MGKNYLYNLTISLVNILFPIITFRYAANILGPEGIGKAQFAISFAEYFSLIAALGIPIYGISATARSKKSPEELSKIFSELISLHTIAGLILSVAYFIIIFTVPYFADNQSLYALAGLLILLGFTSVDWFYFGIEKFKLIAFRSIFIKLTSVFFLFMWVKTSDDVLSYLGVLLFTILGNNFLSLILIRRHTSLSFRGIGIKKHLRPVLFILGSNIAINMYALWDILILKFLTNDYTVGLYFAAIKLVKFAIPVIISLGASLIPKITQSISEKDSIQTQSLLNKTFHFLVLMAIPISMGIFLLAPEFVFVLSGDKFTDSIPVMRMLSILPMLIGFGHFFSLQILVPAGFNKLLFKATFAAAICSIVLNFSLIPYFNLMGAGIANIMAEMLVTTLLFYYVSIHIKINLHWILVPKAMVTSLVFIPIVYLVRNFSDNNYMVLCMSVILCGGVYFMLQFLIFKDLFIKNILSRYGIISKPF